MSQHAPDPQADDELDPGASTQLFQAFVDRYEPGGSDPSRSGGLLIAALIGMLVVLAVALILVLR